MFYNLVDKLYHGATDWMPQIVRDRDILIAPVLGYGGIRGVVKGLQFLSEKFSKRYNNKFDNIALPILERISQVTITLFPLGYSIFDPEGAKEIMTQHPVYTSGMVGLWIGAMQQAQIHIKSKEDDIKWFRYSRDYKKHAKKLMNDSVAVSNSFNINFANSKIDSYWEKSKSLKTIIFNKINPFL